MTTTMKPIYEAVRALRMANKLDTLAAPIAADIRRRMSELLSERELIGVDYLNSFIYADRDVCGSHDYLDANEPVFEAIADFCEREHKIDRTSFHEQALVSDDNTGEDFVVVELMNLGWARVKDEGFSQLWNATVDQELRRDIGVLVFDLPRSEDRQKALISDRQEFATEAFERLGADAELKERIADIAMNNLGTDDILAVLQTVTERKGPSI